MLAACWRPWRAGGPANPNTQPKSVDYRQPTYQDVLDAPPNQVAEIVDGQLHTMPRPAPTFEASYVPGPD